MNDATNEIIEKIIDIEHKANEIYSVAEDKEKHFNEELEKEYQKLDAEYTKRANVKVKQITDFEKANAKTSESESQKYLKEKKANLYEYYNKNKQQWLDDLFNEVVK